MGASNFRFNTTTLYVFDDGEDELKEFWEYKEDLQNLREFAGTLPGVHADECTPDDYNSSYHGETVAVMYFECSHYSVVLRVVINSGYYTGSCFSFDDPVIDVFSSDCRADDWALARLEKMKDYLERELMAPNSTQYRIAAKFSNGETFYEKV